MFPAARLLDMHACPMASPTLPPIPHVGGPITGPCVATVITSMMPQAVIGDMAVCVGPPAPVVKGSATVLVAGRPAARISDTTGHGGAITSGAPTVLIGG